MPPKKEAREASKAKAEMEAKQRYGDVGHEKKPIYECPVEERYKMGRQVCEGSFAKVYEAWTKDEKEEIRAIKVMHKANADTGIKTAWLAQEIEITRRVNHPNIVHLYEIIKTEKSVYYVYEMMDCDLWEFLRGLRKDNMWIHKQHVISIMKSLLEVVAYLHSHDIVHRDIKPENLLIDRATYNVKLTDFGIAKVINNQCTPFGSSSYMAPEIVSGTIAGLDMAADDIQKILMTKESVKQLDLWACGVVFYFLLIGGFPPIIGRPKEVLRPWTRDPELWKKVIFPPKFEDKWASVSAEGKNLVLSLLSVDAWKRPTAADSLNHPFMSEGRSSDATLVPNDVIDLQELQDAVNEHVNEMRAVFEKEIEE
eukprot:TRINITY_DN1278_c1_g1_i1.p1 TRINITY_DN1278_c1_g1~~TRINITY_DN1278_c1_g1_i1.p1  ORF type:complete len:368 (+),score=87.28 TRINITY_DN1278_c1_g1_i1:58-1161(+)